MSEDLDGDRMTSFPRTYKLKTGHKSWTLHEPQGSGICQFKLTLPFLFFQLQHYSIAVVTVSPKNLLENRLGHAPDPSRRRSSHEGYGPSP
jgi:hypothetical protein